MDIKVAASIILSFVTAYLVYSFNDSIFVGINSSMFTAYVVAILVLSTADVFLIIRQKAPSRKLIMILVLIFCLLTSIIVGRIDIEKKLKEGNRVSMSLSSAN